MKTSDIIAIVAIVVSIGSVLIQIYIERARQKREQRASLYKESYKELFLDEVPLAQQKITYDGTYLKGMEDLIACIRKIRLKSYFFAYIDDNFKKNIFKQCQELEDFLLALEENELSNEKYRENYNILNDKMQKMYDTVLAKFY